jgi:hypothetical protein
MRAIHPIKAGVTLGALVGGWHLCWSLLVAVGWAQPLINFIFWMHFIQPVYVIRPFNLGIAVVLVVVTSAAGFLLAYVFSLIWNRLHLH